MLGKEKILEDPMEHTESKRHNKKGHSSTKVDREIPENNLTQTHSSERTERIFPQKATWDPILQAQKVATTLIWKTEKPMYRQFTTHPLTHRKSVSERKQPC